MIACETMWMALTMVALAAPAAPIAIAPVAVEKMSLDRTLYDQLGDALRAAAANARGFSLQDKAETLANLEAVAAAGVDCEADNVECMSKVAVLCGVTRLIVPIARRDGDVFRVRLLILDGSGRAEEVEGLVPVPGEDPKRVAYQKQAASGLMHIALHAPVVAPKEKATMPVPVAAAPPAPAPAPTPAPEPPFEVRPPPMLGLGVLGVGGLLLVGGGAGVLAMDQALATPERFEDRVSYMIVGQVSFAVAGVGIAAAGVGAALLAMTPSES